jgi:glutamate synthase domain-containing protein 3
MAFGAKGITAILEGEVNDYCGKGLSGAKVVVLPPEESAIMAESNVICGNVTLYGATSGFMYIRGLAGERFAVRNSGAHAVVEGLGDHGCEYMTAGSVIVIGKIGRNFAAGMSGGYAFIYDAEGSLQKRINTEMVGVSPLYDEEDESFVRRQLEEHQRLTRSSAAAHILENWNLEKSRFLSIVPSAYRALMRRQPHAHVQPSVRVVGGDNLGAILEEGGYHG